MAIYIKGMEMPKDYSVIVKIFPDGRVGTIPYVQWFKVDLIPGTQAVPVPPHGRLIDADALVDSFDPSDFWNPDAEDNYFAAVHVVNTAPTIIPAEEEGHA